MAKKRSRASKRHITKKRVTKHPPKGTKKKGSSWKGWAATAIVILGLAAFIAFMLVKQPASPVVKITENNTAVQEPPQTKSPQNATHTVGLVVLNDARCKECNTGNLITQLEKIFPGLKVTNVDYSTHEGKQLYKDTGVKYLPALLFKEDVKTAENYGSVKGYLEPAGDYLSLRIGSKFDPTAEICDNGIDDNGNGRVDCDDSSCSGELTCNKRAKPLVELFVMSYCPYGTQTEKGIIPVLELLKDKIDFELHFVFYAMHGEKEVKENTLQYCIQKDQRDRLVPYLRCFLEAGESAKCLNESGINTTEIESCKAQADSEFNITNNLENKASWLSGRFPRFDVDKELNTKYNVGGSPSLAINGIKVDRFDRSSEGLLRLICSSFSVEPSECSQNLPSQSPTPGFGWGEGQASGTTGSCG